MQTPSTRCRIERGYGVFGRELGQEYIPLETGLLDAISFTKGCYVRPGDHRADGEPWPHGQAAARPEAEDHGPRTNAG